MRRVRLRSTSSVIVRVLLVVSAAIVALTLMSQHSQYFKVGNVETSFQFAQPVAVKPTIGAKANILKPGTIEPTDAPASVTPKLERAKAAHESSKAPMIVQSQDAGKTIEDTAKEPEYEAKVLTLLRDNADGPDKFTLVTIVTSGMFDVTMNLLESLRNQGYQKYVVLGLDGAIVDELCKHSTFREHVALVPAPWLSTLSGKNSKSNLLQTRILTIQAILRNKINLFLVAANVVFLHPSVFQHINFENAKTKPEFVYLVDDASGSKNEIPQRANGGFWLAKSSKTMENFFKVMLQRVLQDPTNNENPSQERDVLNSMLLEKNLLFSPSVRSLSRSLYSSESCSREDRFKIKPMVVRMNSQETGVKMKDCFERNGWWFVDNDDSRGKRTLSTKRTVYNYAQQCLLDSPFAPQPPPSILTDPSFVNTIDLEAHYRELIEASAQFRDIVESSYVGYSGPWVETFWIRSFCCNRSLDDFGGLVPLFLQWNDLSRLTNEKWYASAEFKTFTKLLRKDVLYVTLTQSDTGLTPRMHGFTGQETWNILSLSAGGYGHVPIPLLIRPQPVRPAPLSSAKFLFSFTGKVHAWSKVRKDMVSVVKKASARYGTFNVTQYSGKDWIEYKDQTLLNLAPRGYGRSSFHLYEIIQMGFIPVYVHNDHEWIPYRGTNASITEFGFAVHIRNFSNLVDTITLGLQGNPNYLRMDERRAKLLAVRDSHYTFDGMVRQVEYFLKGQGDLRCQRHPVRSYISADPGMR